MIAAHEALLKKQNSSWKDWRRLDLGSKTSRATLKARDMFSDVFTAEYSGTTEVCVVKEPRICRFAAPYIEVLEEENEAVHSIILIRNPMEVAASLTARDGLEKLDGLYLWLTYTLEAELATRGRSRQFLSHQNLMNSPVKTAQSLCKALPFKLTYQVSEVKKQIQAYVSPDLNRQRAAIEDIVLDPLARGWVSNAYEACLILCETPESQAALKTLDNIREVYFSVIEPLHDILVSERARMAGELKSQLAEKYTEYEAGIAALQSNNASSWKVRDEEHSKTWELREQEHEQALKAQEAENTRGWKARDEEMAKAWELREQEHEQALRAQEVENTRGWKARDEEHSKAWELREQEHGQALKARDQEHEKTRRSMQNEHASALEDLEKSFDETLENLQARHKKTKAEWDRSLASQEAEHHATISNMNLEMNFMRDEFGKILRSEEARVDKNAADLDVMRAEMSSVLNSTSWKMTSGLRHVMNLLKGIKVKGATSRLRAPDTPPRLEYKPED